VLEQVGCRYRFVVVGYVVMPEHVHLLLGEPKRGNPSVVMRALADSREENAVGCSARIWTYLAAPLLRLRRVQ
jgi:putative transposase